uniref:Anti-silencing protein, ASF1 family protein n=1 Tax=Toxoplasma gondii COUG TaxID=1074873 RepID=A0A2G8XUC5_TOXGO|nr:anti-silencing protein, ASF1 family protein [Toxoplasma gondii COUG]
MSVVNVTNIRLGNNPSPISSPFVFEICFEALTPLKEDIEWRVVYVGSAECEKKARKKEKLAALSSSGLPSHQSLADGERVEGDMDVEEEENAKKKEEGGGDYLLDSVMLGPIERGVLAFEFAVNAPDYTKVRTLSLSNLPLSSVAPLSSLRLVFSLYFRLFSSLFLTLMLCLLLSRSLSLLMRHSSSTFLRLSVHSLLPSLYFTAVSFLLLWSSSARAPDPAARCTRAYEEAPEYRGDREVPLPFTPTDSYPPSHKHMECLRMHSSI